MINVQQLPELDVLFPVVLDYLLNAPIDIDSEVLCFAESPPTIDVSQLLSLLQTYLI